jgi:selenoprotein W-related protein
MVWHMREQCGCHVTTAVKHWCQGKSSNICAPDLLSFLWPWGEYVYWSDTAICYNLEWIVVLKRGCTETLASVKDDEIMTPRLEIEYCTQCRWLLRAAWLAQELLTTFEKELGEVALVPGANGIFEVRLAGETIFSRRQQGRFPESKEVKQRVRDLIAPERHLGHSDR